MAGALAKDAVRVSIVIPHYYDLPNLARCLDSLEPQLAPDVEIIVADNGSPGGEAVLEPVIRGRARIVTVLERGAGPARNAGVAAARGELLAFIDADCVAHPGWLAAGIEALERMDVAGGPVRVSTRVTPRTGAEVFELVLAFRNERYIREEQFSVTANLLCRASTFSAIGGFRNGVSEDKDWCWRARDLGFTIGLASDAVVSHPARADWHELVKKWRRINRETATMERGRGRSVARWRLRQIVVAFSAVAHAPKLMSMPGLTMGERVRGLATLFAIRGWRAIDGLRIDYHQPERFAGDGPDPAAWPAISGLPLR